MIRKEENMFCPTCGSKIQFEEGALICKTCDSEYDMFDVDQELIPEPIFTLVQLHSQYAIVDTRKQIAYALLDTNEKAQLIASLLNKHFAYAELRKQINQFFES